MSFLRRSSDKVLNLMGYDTVPEDSETPVQEATKQRLGKTNKIQTMYEAGFVKDMHSMLKHDRARVRRYEDEKVFGQKRNGPTTPLESEDEGMIIADDMRHTTTNINRSGGLLQTLGAMGIGAGILYGVNAYMNKDKEPEPPPATEDAKEYEVSVESRVIPPE